MTPILYRISAVLLLIFAAGHTFGFYRIDANAETDAVVRSMMSVQFDILGSTRTYWDLYLGFGFVISSLILFSAAAAWQLSRIPLTVLAGLRGITWPFAIAFGAVTFLAWKFFFILPGVLCSAIVICLTAGAWTSSKQR